MSETLDERLTVAIRVATRHRLSAWSEIIKEHKKHPTFQRHDWPYTLEVGFTCCCSGTEQEFRIPIRTLKEMLPEARQHALNVLGKNAAQSRHGQKKENRAWARASKKAKALLHRYLTREQRWELRATRAFTVKARDGRLFKVTEGSASNVYVTFEDKEYRLCVVLKDRVPTYDLMLAQKTCLETDPETFVRTARVYCRESDEAFEDGGFLVGDKPKAKANRGPLLDLPEEVLDAPQAFVAGLLRDELPTTIQEEVEEEPERILVGGHDA